MLNTRSCYFLIYRLSVDQEVFFAPSSLLVLFRLSMLLSLYSSLTGNSSNPYYFLNPKGTGNETHNEYCNVSYSPWLNILVAVSYSVSTILAYKLVPNIKHPFEEEVTCDIRPTTYFIPRFPSS
jgi:hypothetical protein